LENQSVELGLKALSWDSQSVSRDNHSISLKQKNKVTPQRQNNQEHSAEEVKT